ncbi:MAG TPA: histidine phosphatase family protein [Candidatus Paceibacterota bacterium]|nr:histidine phosphatase family protein [Candidatus Paceibacterota bacterium]
MHVYFVRHGETEENRRHVHQSPNTPLSPRGVDGVRTTASMLRVVNPDLLISSEYTRALESARIIGQHVGLEPVTNGLFYEIVRPSSFYQKSIFSFKTLTFVFFSCMRRNNPSWRYEDAENAVMIADRAQRALAYLESLRGTRQSVVVVSHSVFINVMVAYMCRNTMLRITDMLGTFLRIGKLKNGEVVHLEYVGNGAKGLCNWRIVQDK